MADLSDIEISGYDVSAKDLDFGKEGTFASNGREPVSRGPSERDDNRLPGGSLGPLSAFALDAYHSLYWNPVVGRARAKDALDTEWGRLFKSYDDGRVVLPGPEPGMTALAGFVASALLGGAAWAMRRRPGN